MIFWYNLKQPSVMLGLGPLMRGSNADECQLLLVLAPGLAGAMRFWLVAVCAGLGDI